MFNIVVMVSGGGTNLQAIIDKINKNELGDTRIAAVISSSRKAYALERAKQNNIPAEAVVKKDFDTAEAFDNALLSTIDKYSPDLIVLAGYLVIVPPVVIQKYKNKIINIHPSLIPAFCGDGFYGLKVHEAVLARGCKVTGATVHFVDEGTDTGPIILQKAVYVQPGDTPEILQKRVMEEAEWNILPEAVRLISQGKVNAG
ncbi:MAG: phosphoribosylglycinamide formyltransferase [Lachnospiraceae bacterium]|jgi:phosphoribosylglycinamide formyltransferase-1|nr:phosphoribosylglycinamide formyltransferase [Lachnospiraceae bacterium]MBR6358155.1 phosphoribosylglycinamide formyltransferase [Lachnospiraceae bacterium]